MINTFVNYIKNKNDTYVIFDIGLGMACKNAGLIFSLFLNSIEVL